jgi:hypothetical protein
MMTEPVISPEARKIPSSGTRKSAKATAKKFNLS